MLIDTHLHLTDIANEDDNIANIIKRAVDNDVKYLVVGGAEREDNYFNINLSSKFDNVFVSIGYHPCMASSVTDADYKFLEENLDKDVDNKIVAIGEIGLDYYRGSDNKKEQIDLFRKQLDLAKKYNLPVVIHTRDAFFDTYNILKEYDLHGIIHCFSGSLEVAQKYIKLGYYLGIGGVITFKNSNLKNTIKQVGLDKIVFETDSPYLSPLRGEKNEPCNVKIICEYISSLFDIPYEDVAKITTNNAINILNLNQKI